jgi:hypothetical protein
MGLFYSSPSREPEIVPTDEVVPLRFWDTALCMRGTVLDVSLKIDDCLDIAKIRGALDELFMLDDWKQLGARLRLVVSYTPLYSARFTILHALSVFRTDRMPFFRTENSNTTYHSLLMR